MALPPFPAFRDLVALAALFSFIIFTWNLASFAEAAHKLAELV